MRRRASLTAKGVGRLDEPGPEEGLPQAVDRDACCKGVVAANKPLGEIEPIRPLTRKGVLRAAQRFDRRALLKKYLI